MENEREFAYADGTTMRFSQEIMRKFGHPLSVNIRYIRGKLYILPGNEQALCVRRDASFSSVCIRKLRKTVDIPMGKMKAKVRDGVIVVQLITPKSY